MTSRILILALGLGLSSACVSAQEIGGSATDAQFSAPDWIEAALTVEILGFLEDDIADTYGHVVLPGVEIAIPLSPRASMICGAAYGTAEGSPYYDDPTFDHGPPLKTTLVPVTLGVRVDSSQNRRFRFHMTAAVEAIWVREELEENDEGFCLGFAVAAGPMWRSDDDRLGLELTARWRGSSGDIGSGNDRHTFNTTGIGARLGLSYRFGTQGGRS